MWHARPTTPTPTLAPSRRRSCSPSTCNGSGSTEPSPEHRTAARDPRRPPHRGCRRVSPNGVLGDPTDATPARGEEILAERVHEVVALWNHEGMSQPVAIVTGAGRGIERPPSPPRRRRLVGRRRRPMFASPDDRLPDGLLDDLADVVTGAGGNAAAFEADVSVGAAVAEVVASVTDARGGSTPSSAQRGSSPVGHLPGRSTTPSGTPSSEPT